MARQGSLLDGVDSLAGFMGGGGATATAASGGVMGFFGNVGDHLGDARRGLGFGGDEEVAGMDQQGLGDEVSEMLNMTKAQRMGAFLITFAAGVVMVLISVMFLPMIVIKPAKFALSFSLGNILALFSTMFLVGPQAQLRSMLHPVRSAAAMTYMGSVLLTLFIAIYGGPLRYLLIVVAIVIEVLALLWYAASYVPFGRYLISSLLGYSNWASI